ncbi:hypothetical protein SALBM217S_01306 [Streptomyces griseoloalbus]
MTTTTTPRLKTKYREEIAGKLREQFDENVMQVPGLPRSWSTWVWATPPATPS